MATDIVSFLQTATESLTHQGEPLVFCVGDEGVAYFKEMSVGSQALAYLREFRDRPSISTHGAMQERFSFQILMLADYNTDTVDPDEANEVEYSLRTQAYRLLRSFIASDDFEKPENVSIAPMYFAEYAGRGGVELRFEVSPTNRVQVC